MAEHHLSDLRELLERYAAGHDAGPDITCRHFFSGAAAHADGAIFMTLTSAGLALKLPPADRDHLLREGASPLRYFPKAPIKKEYVVLPGGIAADQVELDRWISVSIAFVGK